MAAEGFVRAARNAYNLLCIKKQQEDSSAQNEDSSVCILLLLLHIINILSLCSNYNILLFQQYLLGAA